MEEGHEDYEENEETESDRDETDSISSNESIDIEGNQKKLQLLDQKFVLVIRFNANVIDIDQFRKTLKSINQQLEEIEIIDELTFKIKFCDNKPIKASEPISNSSNINIPDISKYTDNKIFVCGTEVEDFHTISKEYIFTLNVCATQELHRRIKSQDERIKELETKMTQILNYISI
jgi:hypothetical protein